MSVPVVRNINNDILVLLMFYKHNNNYTVESVTSGHPDKICDQISDTILDAYLAQDPKSRVAVEIFGGHGKLVIGGEVTSKGEVNYVKIARDVYKEIGYDDELQISANIVTQSPDIAMGVDSGGAGDQGIMYGFATNETEKFLPKGVVLVHRLAKRLERARKGGEIKWLQPDGKTQVTYVDGKLHTVLVSAQHSPDIKIEEVKKEITEKIESVKTQYMKVIVELSAELSIRNEQKLRVLEKEMKLYLNYLKLARN